MSIPSHSFLDRAQPLPVLSGEVAADPSLSAFSIEPETLARVVEVAANALVTQEKKTLPFPSNGWEVNVQLTLHLLDGVYIGEVQNGKPHGRGTINYHLALDKAKYEGEWRDGEFHGKGILIYANGDQYEGEWQNGVFHGEGIFKRGDGREIARGKWQFGYLYGKGNRLLWDKDRDRSYKYEGDFVAGRLHGKGKIESRDSTSKVISAWGGEFRDGCLHGHGSKLNSIFTECGLFHSGELLEGTHSEVSSGCRSKTEKGIFDHQSLWEGERHYRVAGVYRDGGSYTCSVRKGVEYFKVDLGRKFLKSLCCVLSIGMCCNREELSEPW